MNEILSVLSEAWELIAQIWDKVAPQWAWLSFMFCSMVIGQTLKQTIWSKDMARDFAWAKIGRKTMHLHAMLFGALCGLLLPMPPNSLISSSILYYATAGATGSFIYQTIKRAKRGEFDIEFVGDSEIPDAP